LVVRFSICWVGLLQLSPNFRFILGALLITAAAGLQADQPVSSGTALLELGAPPPDPPAGFSTSDEAFQAVLSGKVPRSDPPVDPDLAVVVTPDVEYGNPGDRPLLLDLYSPREPGQPLPAIVFIHGGSWRGGKKEDYRSYATYFAQRGYVCASVQYRLSKEAPFPAAVHDAKAAIRFIRANAKSLGVDPQRIGVAGGSAGGHLAMMVGFSSDIASLDGNSGHPGVSSRVQCVVNLYGPTDMTTPYAQRVSTTNPAVKAFFAGTYQEQPELYRAGSPIQYVSPDDPPTLIMHGTVDELVPINQADILATKLAEVGVPYIYDRLPGWPHSMDTARPVNERVLWFAERFFDRYLKD
jgi:acetyl esterase/lipase